MNILYLTPRLPYPPDRGDRLRAFNFIRQLHGKHDVHLLSFVAKESELRHRDKLAEICASVELVHMSPARSALNAGVGLLSNLPLQTSYYKSAEFAEKVRSAAARIKPGVVIAHLFRMFPYVEGLGAYSIVDLTDMVSLEIQRSLAHRGQPWKTIYKMEYPRIANYEKSIGRQADEVWFISDHDADVMRKQNPSARVEVVSQNFSHFIKDAPPVPHEPGRVTMTGNFNVPHNIHAAQLLIEDIFPRVIRRVPTAKMVFAGKNSEKINELSPPDFVEVMGFVDDLSAELQRAAVFVSPLAYCAGLQNKIVEAMINGIPVVTTGICNHGVSASHGENIFVADSSDEFADGIIKCLEDDSFRNAAGEAGMKYAREKFCSDQALRRINEIAAGS